MPDFIYKKMERRWASAFAQGSVRIGSLSYYRTIEDESGTIVDPHEGVEETEVTSELMVDPMILMMEGGNLLQAGSRLYSADDRRLVFCASESTSIPQGDLPSAYDTWIKIATKPAIALIHRALLMCAPNAEGPVFKKVVYSADIDGSDDSPPVRPFFNVLENALQIHERWFTKRTKFKAQGEVRVGWLADPEFCTSPLPALTVAGLHDHVRILD
jgi:hypothetical protein